MAKKVARNFGSESYRQGSLERLLDAEILLNSEQFAGSIYLAGRGVEGMLRAIIWRHHREIREGRQVLETGHDFRELLTQVRHLGLLSQNDHDDAFVAAIQSVSRLWHNNMRYYSTKAVESFWWQLGILNKRKTIKQAAAGFYAACLEIVKRGESLCGR